MSSPRMNSIVTQSSRGPRENVISCRFPTACSSIRSAHRRPERETFHSNRAPSPKLIIRSQMTVFSRVSGRGPVRLTDLTAPRHRSLKNINTSKRFVLPSIPSARAQPIINSNELPARYRAATRGSAIIAAGQTMSPSLVNVHCGISIEWTSRPLLFLRETYRGKWSHAAPPPELPRLGVFLLLPTAQTTPCNLLVVR